MDFDEERDFADQGPLTDMDMEEDAEILALLLKHIPSCIAAADIEQLVRLGDIPVQQLVLDIPVRELYSGNTGKPKARCYPLNMKGHHFSGKNCQVLYML
jgi:hypothetical protein